VEWIVCTHETAFAWTDKEWGAFDPEYFAPIEIPHIAHIPWVLQQGPIPRGILDEVAEIIKNKWCSGVYEPSSLSYNICVFKKDSKSLCLVHSLELLKALTIKNAVMLPYTDVIAKDFAGCSIYTVGILDRVESDESSDDVKRQRTILVPRQSRVRRTTHALV
jgi:hypothetical protein